MRLCHRHRWVRLALSLLAATVMCVVSRSALAAAPQCDVRGAITFAPNPTLDGPKAVVDAARGDDCSSAAKTAERVIQQGRAPSNDGAGDPLPRAAVPAALRVLPATPTAALETFAATLTLPAGIRQRVDRPPRA